MKILTVQYTNEVNQLLQCIDLIRKNILLIQKIFFQPILILKQKKQTIIYQKDQKSSEIFEQSLENCSVKQKEIDLQLYKIDYQYYRMNSELEKQIVEDVKNQKQRNRQIKEYIFQIITVTTFCFLGVIVRIELLNLTEKYHIFRQNSAFFPNSVGSLIMGVVQAAEFKKNYPFLQLGFTVGFCGSLTTFSSWINRIVVIQEDKYIAVDIICGIILPLIFVLIGRFLTDQYIKYYRNQKQQKGQQDNILVSQIEQNQYQKKQKYFFEIGVILFIITAQIIILGIVFSDYFDKSYLYEILFGPLGAIPRFILCDKLNNKIPQFQIGTFLSNLIGTIIAVILQVQCIETPICIYIQFGSMGSLSTVSSWANDTINNFKANKIRSILYNLGTFTVCIVAAIIIVEISKTE